MVYIKFRSACKCPNCGDDVIISVKSYSSAVEIKCKALECDFYETFHQSDTGNETHETNWSKILCLLLK